MSMCIVMTSADKFSLNCRSGISGVCQQIMLNFHSESKRHHNHSNSSSGIMNQDEPRPAIHASQVIPGQILIPRRNFTNMSECCKTGFLWEGKPTGNSAKIAGLDTYVAGSNSDTAILIIHGSQYPIVRNLYAHNNRCIWMDIFKP